MRDRLDDRLVKTSAIIMSSILADGQGVNEIIKQTSPPGKKADRSHIIKALKILQKFGLLEASKKWRFGQKKVLKPTTLGRQITSFIENLKQIRRYSKLLSHWNIKLENNKIIYRSTPGLLIKDEVLIEGEAEKLKDLYYNHWTNGLAYIHEQVDKHIFLSLIYWYGNVLIKFKPNEIAMQVIQAVVISQIKKELDTIMNKYIGLGSSFVEHTALIGISSPIYADVTKIFSNDYYLTTSEFLGQIVSKYIDSISNVTDGSVTGLNYDEHYADKLWNESNEVINNASSRDILDEKLMKAKDNLEFVKIM